MLSRHLDKDIKPMKAPPATQAEYWDRILELSQQTDGKPTAQQIIDTLGVSAEDSLWVQQRVMQKFGRGNTDCASAYESLTWSIESWRGSETGWTNEQYDKLGQLSEKTRAITSATTSILLGIGKPDMGDLSAIESSYRKVSLLNKAFRPFVITREEALRHLAEWESRHG
ncbi:MAG: hypothetical protein ACREP7_04415 [Lysobacter sp.]